MESHGVILASTEPKSKKNDLNADPRKGYKLHDGMFQRFHLMVFMENPDQDSSRYSNRNFGRIGLEKEMFDCGPNSIEAAGGVRWPDQGLCDFESLQRNFIRLEVLAESIREENHGDYAMDECIYWHLGKSHCLEQNF